MGCNGCGLSYVILESLNMNILKLWRSGIVVMLVFIGLMAYTSTAEEPGLKTIEKACCSKDPGCPLEKSATPSGSGSSIIWDSMADNLLSGNI